MEKPGEYAKVFSEENILNIIFSIYDGENFWSFTLSRVEKYFFNQRIQPLRLGVQTDFLEIG